MSGSDLNSMIGYPYSIINGRHTLLGYIQDGMLGWLTRIVTEFLIDIILDYPGSWVI